ncbi:unnamed protein product [Spirodela intermedia]|uniref:Enhancer of polycomb-like protein n=1 Tax=Spirodela intermedia TaxID=51605 RepID=A0A7I8JSH1_SPIIN|nr:unnamed protein product [Spirodela intermedia]CAA6672372.1 unnamed protein product [Spirodela intermedia]
MNRLSFRPRPLDIHKRLPIVKSIKEFEDDDAPTTTSTRSSQLQRIAAETSNEVPATTSSKKAASEIPIPEYVIVDTYERDYTCTFRQPTSYIRARGARAEIGEFTEYDLDDEDEDWLEEFNNERNILSAEKFESLLFKLEVLDHKTRERAGILALTFGSPAPVLLQLDSAAEAIQSQSIRYTVFQSVYNYWKKKREQWRKPILRRLQPPPPVNDTNPYNVFRPREKTHRLYTRRLQRRENNVLSFERLRQVRGNLERAKSVLGYLIKREEKKREVVESEITLQRTQMKYKNEAQLMEEQLQVAGLPSLSYKYGSNEDFIDSREVMVSRPRGRPPLMQNRSLLESRMGMVPPGRMKREVKQRLVSQGWLQERGTQEPVLLFTRPLDAEKLAAAGIVPPPDPSIEDCLVAPPYQFRGRVGRGGRIIFDRQQRT